MAGETTSRTRASAASSAASEDPKTDTPTPNQAVAAVPPPDAEEEVGTFSHERLIAEADAFAFGEPSWVVAGALSKVRKKTLTVDEAKAAIKAFLATEVS